MVFEFMKVMEDEIGKARAGGKRARLEMLEALRRRFPVLLKDLEVEVSSASFSSADMTKLYALVEVGHHDSGDAMIWLKMQNAGLHTILTDNVDDWKKLGARVLS